MTQGAYNTGISIDSRFPAIFFFYKLLNHPGIILDGQKHKLKWGAHFVSAAPGTHEVTFRLRVFYGLIGVGSKKVELQVTEGRVTQVLYKPNWMWIWAKGKVEVGGQQL